MAGEERWGGGSGINSLWLAHLPRGIRPDYQDFRRSVNEPAEWTDPAEIRMRVALHFIKAKGKRPRMEKESLGGGRMARKDPTVSTLVQLPLGLMKFTGHAR